ncbi:MAG: SPOR domain-containing protein [Burkholderiaceae bacterium]|jgi:cell division protein FtsN|nr:SPOR domain-containing protein [Burkholderiaceae bacterium]
MMNKHKQRGDTFLGIVLGILIGLAIALGVAVYVAKVPMPFKSKEGVSRTGGQDAAEAEKNKNWDPNAALRNKNGGAQAGAAIGQPAPDAALPPPAEATGGGARPPTVATQTDGAAATNAARSAPTSADPLGDLVAARMGTQAQSGGDPFIYYVQAGAFRTLAEAESQRVRLSLSGMDGKISESQQAGHTVHRVRVGPFQNQDAAERVKARLADGGFEAALVRAPRAR